MSRQRRFARDPAAGDLAALVRPHGRGVVKSSTIGPHAECSPAEGRADDAQLRSRGRAP